MPMFGFQKCEKPRFLEIFAQSSHFWTVFDQKFVIFEFSVKILTFTLRETSICTQNQKIPMHGLILGVSLLGFFLKIGPSFGPVVTPKLCLCKYHAPAGWGGLTLSLLNLDNIKEMYQNIKKSSGSFGTEN